MVFAKRFCTAAAAIIFLFVLAIQALAVSIDGSVSPDEVHGTNVQIQCENENGGNGICALATYYTKTEKGSLYVAISVLQGRQNTTNSCSASNPPHRLPEAG